MHHNTNRKKAEVAAKGLVQRQSSCLSDLESALIPEKYIRIHNGWLKSPLHF